MNNRRTEMTVHRKPSKTKEFFKIATRLGFVYALTLALPQIPFVGVWGASLFKSAFSAEEEIEPEATDIEYDDDLDEIDEQYGFNGTYAEKGMIEEEAYAESLGDFGVDGWI